MKVTYSPGLLGPTVFAAFFIAKAGGWVDWPWLVVFAPLWIPLVPLVLGLVFMVLAHWMHAFRREP